MPSNGRETLEKLIQAGIEIAIEKDYKKMSRNEIARRAGYTAGLIHHYFTDMDHFLREIMQRAIDKEIPQIVARGILDGHPTAITAGASLRRKCSKLFK